MNAGNLCRIYNLFTSNNIELWIDGGWGIDALLNEQSREHSDLDIVIQEDDLFIALELLKSRNFKLIYKEDSTKWNFVYSDGKDFIDFHIINFDANGNGIYGPKENGVYYPAYAFGSIGYINGLKVNCISPQYQLESHSGYELRDIDYFDINNLCIKFNLEHPYKSLKN